MGFVWSVLSLSRELIYLQMLDLNFSESDWKDLCGGGWSFGKYTPKGIFRPSTEVVISSTSSYGFSTKKKSSHKKTSIVVTNKCCVSSFVMDASYVDGILKVLMCVRVNFEGGVESYIIYNVSVPLTITSFETTYKDVKVGLVPEFKSEDIATGVSLVKRDALSGQVSTRIPYDDSKYQILENGKPVSYNSLLKVAENNRMTSGLLSGTFWPIIMNFLMMKGLSLGESKYFL